MPCVPCAAVRQYVVNLLLALDRLLNALTLGSPNQTISQRTARAELAGSRVACAACRVMGLFDPGHCAWSLTPGTIGRELWDWTPRTPRNHAAGRNSS